MNVHTEENSDECLTNEVLFGETRAQKRLASRPSLDHLEDAVAEVEGNLMFLLSKGDRLVIERKSTYLTGHPWLDTKVYTVKVVDQVTGDLKLFDEEYEQSAMSNFKTTREFGFVFKKAPKKGNPFTKSAVREILKEKEPKQEGPKPPGTRRIYLFKGIICTRVSGVAYAPLGTTKATDGMRLITMLNGHMLNVRHPEEGWEEVWAKKEGL